MELRFVRNSSLPRADIGLEDLALFDAEKGKYFGLEGVASRIWQLLEGPISIRELCERLIVDFDVTPGECREQVQTFIAQLIQEGLVFQLDETSGVEKR